MFNRARNAVADGLNAAARAITPPNERADGVDQEEINRLQANLNAEQLRQQLENVARERRAARAAERRNHERAIIAKTKMSLIGRKIDHNTKTYVAAQVKDYCDDHGIEDPAEQLRLIELAEPQIMMHVRTSHRYHFEDIVDVQTYNENISGRIDEAVWYNPLTWHLKCSFTGNENGASLSPKYYTLGQGVAVGLAGIAIAGIGSYFILRAYRSLNLSTITPNVSTQPLLPTTIDIPQLSSLSTTLDKLVDYTDTLRNSSAIQVDLVDKPTLTGLTIQLSGLLTSKLYNGLKLAVDHLVESSRSPR